MKSEVDQIPENGNDKNTGQANEALQAGHLVSAHDSSLFPIDGQSGSDNCGNRETDSQERSSVCIDDRVVHKYHLIPCTKKEFLLLWHSLTEDYWSMLKIGFFAGIIFGILLVRYLPRLLMSISSLFFM